MIRRLHVRQPHDFGDARIDDDQLGALPDSTLHLRREHRMPLGDVRADHHDHVGLHHRIEILGRRRGAERGLESVAGRRMTNARAGVDVVVAERGAHQFLHEKSFLVGASRGRNRADRAAPVLFLDALELRRGVFDRVAPRDLAPRLVDRFANHRARDAIGMRRVAPREAALDARMAVIGLPVGIRHHPRDEVALHLGAERASDAAVSAGRDDAVIRLAEFDDRFFHQRRGRTRLHARAARNALGRRERAVLSRRNHRRKSAPVDRQRERALHFLARADASRAHDAFRRIESEIRIRLILLRVQMVGAVAVAVAHLAQAHRARHVLQLAIAVGGTGQAVERMIGNVQLHHAAAQPRERGTLGAHLHPGPHRSGA